MIGLVSRNRRRYGGFIVHAGMVLIFLGFAGEGFSRDQQLLLKPGEEARRSATTRFTSTRFASPTTARSR